jgi:hypothetical protein
MRLMSSVLLIFALAGCCRAAVLDEKAQAETDADHVVTTYGLSWSGAKAPMPRAAHAPDLPPGGATLVRVLKPPEHTADGFTQEVVIIATPRSAWVHRTGGFAGVDQWFGPLELAPGKP